MPTTIALESKNVTVFGVETPYQHLYLVKTITDAFGSVLDERVIRGDVGADLTLVTQANVPLALTPDARGGATPAERHRTIIDLGGRNPEAVWSLMVQHATAIDRADLPYGTGVGQAARPGEVNSNTTIGSVLRAVGIDLGANLPPTIDPGLVPLYHRVDLMFVNDVLIGSRFDDLILGGVGHDTLDGRAGNDRLVGEDGNDTLYGRTGNDRLFGQAGNDILIGGWGNDRLDGGLGADQMVGGAGNDHYRVNERGDRVIETDTSAAGGYDRVVTDVSLRLSGSMVGVERLVLAGSANITGIGNALANWITGNAGDNRLFGGSGGDAILGGAGDDRIHGGGGSDALVGGSGRDVYAYHHTWESAPAVRDRIRDFENGDRIDVSRIDANVDVAGDQAFTWIGSGAFTGAGQLRFEAVGTGSALVQGDVNGDFVADFEVLLRAYAAPLSASDFVL